MPKDAAKKKAQKPIGTATHFYNHIRVAIVKFNAKVPVGTGVGLQEGATTDFAGSGEIDAIQPRGGYNGSQGEADRHQGEKEGP